MIAATVPGRLYAQADRDYIRQDDEGHLILRFAGSATNHLTPEQNEEVLNAFVSVMVHDRLRADINFELERIDAQWSNQIQPLLLDEIELPESLNLNDAECRSEYCRLIFTHSDAWRISEHQELMNSAQRVIELMLANLSNALAHEFLIAAYSQERETQYIKVYLARAR